MTKNSSYADNKSEYKSSDFNEILKSKVSIPKYEQYKPMVTDVKIDQYKNTEEYELTELNHHYGQMSHSPRQAKGRGKGEANGHLQNGAENKKSNEMKGEVKSQEKAYRPNSANITPRKMDYDLKHTLDNLRIKPIPIPEYREYKPTIQNYQLQHQHDMPDYELNEWNHSYGMFIKGSGSGRLTPRAGTPSKAEKPPRNKGKIRPRSNQIEPLGGGEEEEKELQKQSPPPIKEPKQKKAKKSIPAETETSGESVIIAPPDNQRLVADKPIIYRISQPDVYNYKLEAVKEEEPPTATQPESISRLIADEKHPIPIINEPYSEPTSYAYPSSNSSYKFPRSPRSSRFTDPQDQPDPQDRQPERLEEGSGEESPRSKTLAIRVTAPMVYKANDTTLDEGGDFASGGNAHGSIQRSMAYYRFK